jgi:hypothetical protein
VAGDRAGTEPDDPGVHRAAAAPDGVHDLPARPAPVIADEMPPGRRGYTFAALVASREIADLREFMKPSAPPIATLPGAMTRSSRGSGLAARVRAFAPVPVWALALAVFAIHLAVVAWGPYGPHRDALLYYAMGARLRLFAMDFPPFIALVARAFTMFGNVELLTHVPVAAAHAALVLLAAAFARRAGGGAGSQALAALAVATAPIFLRAGSLFQPVVFDQLWWTAAYWTLAGIGVSAGGAGIGVSAGGAGTGDAAGVARRRWLGLGAILGLALLTKFTALALGAGILVGLLATPGRRWLATPWPWLAAALALLVGSPSLIGQMVLGWPFLGQYQDLAASQLARVTPASFALEQLLLVGPIVLLAAAGGVAVLVRPGDTGLRVRPGDTGLRVRPGDAGLRVRPGEAGLRVVVWSATASFVLMMLASGKAYYIAPIWPALLGITLGRTDAWLRVRRARLQATGHGLRGRVEVGLARGTLWVLVAGWGALTVPLGLPFLPPEPMARYAARLGSGATTTNVGHRLNLPQDYADMLGWDELAAATEAVWRRLPPEDRRRAVIIATNYGRAGAIDWFTGDDVPPVVAPIGSYWFFGPGDLPGEVAVVVGDEAAELEGRYFRSAVEATRVLRPWGVPEEQDVPIVIARDPIRPLQEIWPEFRGRN